MIEAYNKSLQMINYLGIKLTKKQYNQLAKRFNLLSVTSLQYMAKRNFNFIIREATSNKNYKKT